MVNRVHLVALAVAIAATIHAEHPSLLVTKSDLPRIRHACGVGQSLEDPSAGAFGARRGDFQAVRLHVSTQLTAMNLELSADGQGAPSGWLPGELVAAAFLHLVEPDDPGDTKRILAIEDALHATNVQGEELIERIIALDWCWSAIEPAARREFLMAVRSSLKPLSPADSPLDHGGFRDRLAGLAAAAAFDADDELGEWWNELRVSLLGGARPWVESTLPTYLQWRGGIPTSPESGPQEECDAALAVEFASRLVDDAWTRHHEAIGRSLEHYLAVGSLGEAGGADFVRDVPGEGALSTAPQWKSLLPLTAHLITARSRDSAAALIADAVERGMSDKTDLLRHAWRWIPIIFDLREISRADPTRPQTLRNLGGVVVLRGEGRAPTTIWIDTGQPFLQARQHFDAGGFLIRRGADLAVSAADDLGQYAVQSRKGAARLGESRDAFDFAQFNSATIAHNAMLYTEPNRITRWYGKIYAPAGGQIPREGTCRDFRRSLDEQGRATGRLIACGSEGANAYVAIDLTAAYDSRAAVACTREFVWVLGKALVVVDRAQTPEPRITPTWVVNVPTQPTAGGRPLPDGQRTAGKAANAGVWEVDGGASLRVTNRGSAMTVLPLSPRERRVVVMGGPADPIEAKAAAGRTWAYYGSDANGFERLINPIGARMPPNAWYRLGSVPTGAERTARAPHWGRVEIEPTTPATEHYFVTVLVLGDAADQQSANGSCEVGEGITVRLALGEERVEISLSAPAGKGGKIRIGEREWRLPTDVAPDEPWPTR